jgi:hypothetical protein
MANPRMKKTMRDMVLSLGAIAVPTAALTLLTSPTAATPVATISAASFQTMLSAARSGEDFQVLAPVGLPAGWRVTSENYTMPGDGAADWHVGYLIPQNAYAELEQTTEPIGGFLSDAGSDAAEVANVQISGVTWQEYTGTTPAALKILLVRTATGDLTELVAGSAPLAQLEQLAASLKG